MRERIAIFGAMPWECRPVLASLPGVRRGEMAQLTTWRRAGAESEIVVVKTGIGPERAAEAVDVVLREGGWSTIISTGCAGALRRGLAAGDLAIATHAVMASTDSRYLADARLGQRALEIASAAGLTSHAGPVLCVGDAFTSAAQKAAAAAHGHIAVEMEGAAIAARATAAGIPYLSVRAVLDDADTELQGGRFVDEASGKIKPLALVRYVARRPSAVTELLSMRTLMSVAERSLQRFFHDWFER